MKPAARAGVCLKRGLEQLIQQDGSNQTGGADDAEHLQQSEGFAGGGGDVLRRHEVFLKMRKSEMVHGRAACGCRMAQTFTHEMPLSLPEGGRRWPIAYRAEMD